MKYILKIAGLFLLILSIVTFNSCKKEDNIPPVITSFNLTMNDTVRNNFVIKIEATDNNKTSRLELFANDSLIARLENLPFEYLWNTTAVKDGEYIIKAIVYDSNGNKVEASSTVFVQNALLTLNLGNENPSSFKVVISDEQGNILNSALVQGSGKVRIMPLTQFENEGINFVYCYVGNGFTALIGYVHVKRGSEYNLDWNSTGPVQKGIKIHLKNDIGAFSQVILSTDQASYKISAMADTINLPNTIPYTSGHKLLLQLVTSEGRFYDFLTIDNTEELSVKLSDVFAREAVKTFSFPAAGHASYLLMASSRINEKDSIYRYYLSEGENALNENHFDIYYPAEYFSRYHTGILFSHYINDYKSYLNQYRGVIPESFDPISADFEIVNSRPDNFKANISGNFDLYHVLYYDPSQTIELQVSVPVNQKEWKLPDLATAFNNTEFRIDNFTWNQVSIVNQGSLDWSNKYYDISLNFEQLNFVEKYTQYEWIYNPISKRNKQFTLP